MDVTSLTATAYAFRKALDQPQVILGLLNTIPEVSSGLNAPEISVQATPPVSTDGTGQIIDILA